MINREKFFTQVRRDFGKLKQSQVDGFEDCLSYFENYYDLNDVIIKRRTAYKLATFWHETACTMQPIYERGSHAYFNKYEPHTRIGKMLGNTKTGDGYLFRGRGLVQITGRANYGKMGKILGIDLVADHDKALDMTVALDIADEGMETKRSFRGDFTGRSLANYFNLKTNDPVGARAIINGRDRAHLIAGYHYKFLKALT